MSTGPPKPVEITVNLSTLKRVLTVNLSTLKRVLTVNLSTFDRCTPLLSWPTEVLKTRDLKNKKD
jgi:hypothetical protein